MKLSLVELEDLSGDKAAVYSLLCKEDNKTLFDKFIEENKISHLSEVKNIINRLETIGKKTGSQEYFFKKNEGNIGDGVVALYDNPDKKLRLYCIRFGSSLLVIGGGGEKPKNIKSLQENDKLTEENYLLRDIVKCITAKFKNSELRICQDDYGDYFDGELDLEIESN